MANFGGDRYELAGLIAQSSSSSVFRALDLKTGETVALKILHGFCPEDGDKLLARYRKNRDLSRVQHPGIARHINFDRWNNTYYFVEEYCPGLTLDKALLGATWNSSLAIEMTVQVAEALQHCHNLGLFHLEIKPKNILLSTLPDGAIPGRPQELKVRLLGLAQSLILGSLKAGRESVEVLSYMSPEQVGILNKPPEARSDLYSLGVVLYRSLTGKLPYEGEDAVALVHQMVAKIPAPLKDHDLTIPKAIEAVVMKAIAKNPDERYGSLENFRSELLLARSAIQQDAGRSKSQKIKFSSRLDNPLPLTERDVELKRLCARFDQSALGRGSYVLLTGEPGIGKTRLIEDLRNHVLAHQGMFLWCQATEFEKNQPYSPLRDAIKQFVQHTQGLPVNLRSALQRRLESAVGNFGQELSHSIPEISKLLSAAPELVALEPEREQQRSARTMMNLFQAVGGPGQPVVLFIDDCQWVDKGTRDLVEKLSGVIGKLHLLLICSENRTGIPSEDEDAIDLNKFSESIERVHIHLNPLSLAGCRRIFELGLGQSNSVVNDLATVAYERCGGNPRLLLELIKTLLQEMEESQGKDSSEIGLLQLQKLLPEANVDAFVLRRLKKLSPLAQKIISVSAVVGRKFSLSLVEKVAGCSRSEVLAGFREGFEHQIIASWNVLGEDWHCFTHELIHKEIYQSLPGEVRLELHRKIGDALAGEEGSRKSGIYEIALHYLRGDDLKKACHFAMEAARAAKKAYANREAIYFFTECLNLKLEDEVNHELEILEGIGDACALDGQYDKAESSYQRALESVKDPIHKARLEGKIGDMHFRRGMNEAAIEHLTRGLSWLGLRSPRTRLGLWWSISFNSFRQFLHTLLPKKLLTVGNQRAQDIGREAVKIFHSLAYAYYFLDLPRTLEVHLRQLNLAERLGESRELAHTYSSHGIVCSLIPMHRRAIHYQKLGLEIRKRIDDRWGIGQSYAFLGVCCYYRSELSMAIDCLQKSIRILESMGDQWEIEAAYSHLGFCYNLIGDADSAEQINRTLLKLSEEIHDLKFIAVSQISLAESELIRGNLDRALNHINKSLTVGADNFTRAMAMRVQGQILLRMGKRVEAHQVLEESLALMREHHLFNEYLVANHLAFAQSHFADVNRILAMGRAARDHYLAQVKKYVDKGVRLAGKFKNHLGYALRIRAIYQRLRGLPTLAEKDFALSSKILMEQGRLYEMGLTLLESARWRFLEGNLKDTDEVERVIEIFRKVGARLDLEAAQELLGLQTVSDRRPQKLRTEHRQLSSLFKMSRTISSILDLERLVIQITDLAVEVTGGERGYLFLRNPKGEPGMCCARGADRNSIDFGLPPEAAGVVQKTWKTGVAQVASLNDGSFHERAEEPDRGRSAICVPLRIGDETISLLYIENGLTRDLYSENDLEFITVFAAQAAISLQNAFSYQKIEELNLSLEKKVQDRTRELLRSKQEVENANRLKSEFLANMSHELRTPLNAIIAMSEILAEKTFGGLNQKQETYVKQILESGIHLLSLINDILDLSKVEAGMLKLEIDPFSLNDLLKHSLTVVKERALRHQIALSFVPESAVDMVCGDVRRIKQVVYNLLTNAVKFTPDGGQVTIRTLDQPGSVAVCVEDTGIGISKEDLSIIFDEFRQVDSSFSRKYEGTGLGLSLCKKFIELHNGRIWVESEVGKGSRFYFSLPLSEQPPSKKPLESMAAATG